MQSRDLYEILGVSRTASEQEIRKAYRDLARKYHPDRNPGDDAAEERFKEASYASEVLLNKEKRKLYDEFGEIGLREGFEPEAARQYTRGGPGGAQGFEFSGNLEDLLNQMGFAGAARGGGGPGGFGGFADIFGGAAPGAGGFRGARRRPPPQEVMSEVTISFAEAVRGTERELGLSMPGETTARTLRVRIPAGVGDGGKVRLRGQGPGGGDIVLKVHVQPHEHFERDGDDLLLDLPVTVGEAFEGAKVQVPTPDGPVSLTIPKGVRGGSKLRLRGKGVQRGARKGDLIVRVEVVLPESEDPEVRDAVDRLEQAYSGSVRGRVSL
ncbi:MAG: J domain-containing protein [Myxococcales bacterium]|jgi:curved DNA-binding protein